MTLESLPHHLTDEEVMPLMGVKTKAGLQSRISSGKGHPPYFMLGRKRYYYVPELLEWLKSQPRTYEVAQLKGRNG